MHNPELGYTLDEFTTEVNKGSAQQYTNEQTEPYWSQGYWPAQARAMLAAK
jgi:hypothetical protein